MIAHVYSQAEDDVHDYIDGVLSGEIVAGRLVKLACERHLKDLEDGHKRGLKFDRDIATRACAFFPMVCRHSIGEWDKQPFHLSPWQKFATWSLFGWREIDTGCRRFRRAYMSVARKNGKTTWCAALALLLMYADEPFEAGAEVYIAATKIPQAMILYKEAVRMVQASPALKSRSLVRKAPHSVQWNDVSSSLCPVASDGNLDGLNPHGIFEDELHAWTERHRQAKEKLTTGGGARRQPLEVMITTAGDDNSLLWKEEDEHAVRVMESVLTGNIIDDGLFAFVARIDEEDDPFDESVWAKANPNLGISPKVKYLQEKAELAKQKPSEVNKFIRYQTNRQVSSSNRAIPIDWWLRGKAALTIQPKAYGHGGIDLGRSDDWCAISACFPVLNDGKEIDHYELKSKAWICKDGSFDCSKEPFRSWIKQGILLANEGDQIDWGLVRAAILEWHDEYDITSWAYDPAFARLLEGDLTNDHGLTLFKFTQSAYHYNEPCVRFVQEMKAGRIWHANEPILSWQFANLNFHTDSRGLVMPDKSNRASKIDAAVASIMAFSECLFAERQGPAWSREDGILL